MDTQIDYLWFKDMSTAFQLFVCLERCVGPEEWFRRMSGHQLSVMRVLGWAQFAVPQRYALNTIDPHDASPDLFLSVEYVDWLRDFSQTKDREKQRKQPEVPFVSILLQHL